MNWNQLTSLEDLEKIRVESHRQPVVIFKHSTRCSISSAALARFEKAWNESAGIVPYYLDLLAYRPISNAIATEFQVEHQSPQALLIQNGVCVFHESHFSIDVDELKSRVAAQKSI